MIFDLHVHTTHSSCSGLSLAEILRHARLLGLDGVCVTDHNTLSARNEISEGVQNDGLCIIFGMEYDTPEGDFLIFGSCDNLKPGMKAREMLALVARQGGVAVAAHPCRNDRAVDPSLWKEGLCRIVESINGRNRRQENRRIQQIAVRYGLVQCGGSDAHHLSELGKSATHFNYPVRNCQDLVKALQEGACHPLSIRKF